ncbi:MAG TPA: H(+)/Cl(-) exchange transporter ClcA [Opitutaceae bacterium]|jgi:CIC family chloride channel protein|nr:H(+)/Cl(-) exchange transporter ClcA [Opitutaceae bacterium]
MNSSTAPGSGLKSEEVKRRHILPKALIIGLVAGLIASLFRRVLQAAELGRIAWLHRLPFWESLPVAVGLGALGSGAGLWLVRRFAPEAAGSGIPHLKSVVLGEKELRWKPVLPVKFLAGLLGIGGGLALGREGPTIQMGGATGLMVSSWFRVKSGEGERRALVSAGAGAGLAAAFNAPLAGMVFVLEELHGAFTPVIFVATFLASVTADVVCRVATGDTPVFALHGMPVPGLSALPVALVLGILAGFGGVLFNRGLLASLDFFDRFRRRPPFLVGAAAGALIGLAAWIYPDASGSGALLAERAFAGDIALRWVIVLAAVRFALTMVSYGSGAAGGIFAPLLVIGALTGLATGTLAHAVAPSLAPHPEVFAVLGMGAALTAIVRAPLTGIVLMIELTGEYDFMLPLLVSCFAAYGVAEALRDRPIYEALRERAPHPAAS